MDTASNADPPPAPRGEFLFSRAGPCGASAILPRRATAGSAGYDLCAASACSLPPRAASSVPTGWSVRIPRGKFMWIAPRSGLAARGIAVGGGIVDSDYTGEVRVILFNHTDDAVAIEEGDRVGQAIVMDCEQNLVPAEVAALPPLEGDMSARGGGGFGSTGR